MSRVRDAVIIGAGHNGLTCAAYLARAGLDVLVLERRDLVGGCAVSETASVELPEGGEGSFTFSRASYLAGLLRPHIVKDLKLMESYGLKLISRDPYSFTPAGFKFDGARGDGGLTLWTSLEKTKRSIEKYSKRDAEAFEDYEVFLDAAKSAIVPLLDGAPPDVFDSRQSMKERWEACKRVFKSMSALMPRQRRSGTQTHQYAPTALEVSRLFTSPATVLLDEWFESDILKTTLCTDAVIGSMTSPAQPGSAYVLLHHVMGESLQYEGGAQGSPWCYAQGGMGSISNALAKAALDFGAEIRTGVTVDSIQLRNADRSVFMNQRSRGSGSGSGSSSALAKGVLLQDGTEHEARMVISGCDPLTTFTKLIRGEHLNLAFSKSPGFERFYRSVQRMDFSCGAAKINLAVRELPSFACLEKGVGARTGDGGKGGPEHRGTIHFEHSMKEIESAWQQCSLGMLPDQPVIEMTIPSSLDNTLAPPGCHVVQLFVQYIPYELRVDSFPAHLKNLTRSGAGLCSSDLWLDERVKKMFVDRVLNRVELFCPGFKDSILHVDALSPLDLETVFGIPKGNIFHGSLSLHQLFHQRPVPGFSSYQSPVPNVYLCGSGAHPGGGVSGAPGHNAAQSILASQHHH